MDIDAVQYMLEEGTYAGCDQLEILGLSQAEGGNTRARLTAVCAPQGMNLSNVRGPPMCV